MHQHREHEPDRALAENDNNIVRLRVALHDGFEAGVEWLDKCRALEGNVIGDALDAGFHDPVHHPDVLREAAAGGLKAGRDPNFLVCRALRIYLTLAIEALSARDVMKGDHTIAALEFGYAATHRGNHAGGFMAV